MKPTHYFIAFWPSVNILCETLVLNHDHFVPGLSPTNGFPGMRKHIRVCLGEDDCTDNQSAGSLVPADSGS